jgi:hypothetical protein
MIKISTIFALGILIALVPFSGFSADFKYFLYVVFGLSVSVLSYLIRKELHEVLKHLHDATIKTESEEKVS